MGIFEGLTFNDIFKAAAGLFSIGMIAFVTSQDTDNSNEQKAYNTIIVVIQSLMVLLMYLHEKFTLTQLLGIWAALFLAQVLFVYLRFKDKKTDAIWAFVGGNALIIAISMIRLPIKGKSRTEKKASSPDEQSQSEATTFLEDVAREQEAKKAQGELSRIQQQISRAPKEKKQEVIRAKSARTQELLQIIEQAGQSPLGRTGSPVSTSTISEESSN